MQESLAKTGKYHQEAIKILMGLLKAIGPAGFPLVQRSTEFPGFVITEAQPLSSSFLKKVSTQSLPHLTLSFKSCLLKEGK